MDKWPNFGIETGYLFASKYILIKNGNIGSRTGNGNITRSIYYPK
tara:strand:+ start:1015 stop:1149 length:135 start_codon:yes stop_codon:yes gene_type:complete